MFYIVDPQRDSRTDRINRNLYVLESGLYRYGRYSDASTFIYGHGYSSRWAIHYTIRLRCLVLSGNRGGDDALMPTLHPYHVLYRYARTADESGRNPSTC